MADSPSELNAEIEKLELKHAEHPEGRFFVPLANAYRKAGDVEHAESLLREGLRRHPDYLSAHIVLGRCLADRGAMAEASEEFRYVLSIDPQNLIALRTLGELAVAGSRRDEAVRWYEELLGVDPMNEDARRALESLRQGGTEVGEEFRAGGAWWDADQAATPSAGAVVPAPVQDDTPSATAGGAGDDVYDPFSTGNVTGLEAGEPELQDPPAAGEVVTETIAELYARQGLVERAAGVYRELIRRRGESPALQRRLAELEHQLSSATDAPVPQPTTPPPPPEPATVLEREPEPEPEVFVEEPGASATDPFATSFEYGFQPQDQPEAAPAEPEAVAPAEAASPMPAPGIAEFLRTLVAWRAETGPQPVVDAPGAGEPSLPVAGFTEASPAMPDLPGVGAVEPKPAPEPRAAAAEESTPEPTPEPAAEAEPFPWEASAPVAPAAPVEEPDEELFSLESFFNEVDAPEPATGAPADASSSATDEEDDDLESFQAWLRSLKR